MSVTALVIVLALLAIAFWSGGLVERSRQHDTDPAA